MLFYLTLLDQEHKNLLMPAKVNAITDLTELISTDRAYLPTKPKFLRI